MFEPIAIVGRSCILPGAHDPDALWTAVVEGRDLLGPAPADRWGIEPNLILTEDPRRSADRSWSNRGGYVSGFDFARELDADPFYRDAPDLLALDPLVHWVLSAGRRALREAGHDGRTNERVAAVIGNLSFPSSRMSAYAEHVWLGRPSVDPRNRFMSGLPALLLADELGLGASYALDAACASSLYAIALACRRLQARELDLALAGAVCRSDDLFIHVGFCALDAMSKSGRSRPFHREADGLVPAEGCAFVALERLSDAVASGKRIFGVIRGVGLANDGRGRGLLAPASEGQARALRAAWAASGVDPARLSLVECHATGTTVGDGTEIETLNTVFGDRSDLPIGSLKSNLGHLITAAGGAALLKVLGAMQHGVRPPSLHTEALLPALDEGPLRVLRAPEPWPSDGPRVAAIDAFGFGGNNAHLIVEAHVPSGVPMAAVAPPPPPPSIAVVAVAARVADGGSTAAFDADLRAGGRRIAAGTPARAAAVDVVLPLERLKFPPRDLDQTLAQQLLVLEAALEATDASGPLPRERTAVLIGAQADPEVCRYGARWRLPTWHPTAGAGWIDAARDQVVPVLEAPAVVGTMPNIPANRVSSQLDLGGPAFTVAMEERSGFAALRAAHGMLAAGTVDAALVGATDLSAEVVHETAASAVGIRHPAGDAAVVLVLMRKDQALAERRPVLATIGLGAPDEAAGLVLGTGDDAIDLRARFGASHAASDLVHVAAAVLACAGAVRPLPEGPADPWDGARVATVRMRSVLGGGADTAWVKAVAPEPLVAARRPAAPARPWRKRAHPAEIHLPLDPTGPEPLTPGETAVQSLAAAPRLVWDGAAPIPAIPAPQTDGALVPAPLLAPLAPRPPEEPPRPSSAAAPIPALPSAPTPRPAPSTTPAPGPASAPTPAPPPLLPTRSPAPASATAGLAMAATGPDPAALAHFAVLHRQLAAAHAAYVDEQQRIHAQFLQVRARIDAALVDAASRRTSGAVIQGIPAVAAPPVPPPTPIAAPTPTPTPTPTRAPTPTAPTPAQVPAPPTPTAPRLAPATTTPPTPKPAPTPAPSARSTPSALPGPKWSRADLEILASDKISRVFGPQFALQDGYPRQVRMPEPPLLLADRVTGLDAEPGSMKTGTIWTETDVTWDAWYLHDGSMPAGVMIEAGQADLLLISWLGADFENRGERVYRLLGCTLTYGGGLPRPGDTLKYEIHVDGHAKAGPTRIFFFHYDCVDQHGVPRLQVRQGQAGFFSDAELAESGGILWDPATGEHDAAARLDLPLVAEVPSRYDQEQVLAFARGDGYRCFGKGYARLASHVRTPRIAPPPMSFWQRVTALDPKGGPWKRGYFLAEQDITPEDWFFQGHFKADPCMPGTMMFEACLQALAFLMTAYGFTLERDGWTFEIVPDVPYDLRCRGQVIPSSKFLTYEVFVEEVHAGDGSTWPTVYADFLCTVDGLKAFHARRVGVRLRPDWPMTSRPELQIDRIVDPVPVAATPDGFRFGYHSLLSCAWGKPSEAFGPMYAPFDGGKHCARLPGPPYHFMSRVTHVEGPINGMKVGTAIALEYDVPPDAWYFADNGFPTMPYCVLLEAALQPCGWIASYVGSAARSEPELYFRNLDGTATWSTEVLPTSGVLTTRAKITTISTAGGMIIEGFDVTCTAGDAVVFEMKTVFGFFPGESLRNQIGITPTPADRAALVAPSDFLVDLTPRPPRYFGQGLRMQDRMLSVLDRITGFWPEGGAKGLGRLRSEKDVDPTEWFFQAHFFGDPVQPGSLGLEALVQLLQFWMIHTGQAEIGGISRPRFEPLMLGRPITWKYRGQVVPRNKLIRCELEIVEIGSDERGRYAVADGYLWVDETRIYQATSIGMRIVEGPPQPTSGPGPAGSGGERVLDPAAEPWLRDHPPTWTLPALPATVMADHLAAAAEDAVGGGLRAVGLRDVQIARWITLPGPVRTRAVAKEVRRGDAQTEVDAALEVWRDAGDPRLSRFEPAATGTVLLAATYPAPPAPLPKLQAAAEPDPYASGALFHGPAFQALTALAIGPDGSSAALDAARNQVPAGRIAPGLLDAVTHAVPHDTMHRWSSEIPEDRAAYPSVIERLDVFGPPPTGTFRVEARFDGMLSERQPRVHLQAIAPAPGGERVWVDLTLVEILLPKGPIGEAPPADRVAFLRDRRYVPGLGLSRVEGAATVATLADIRATDWLPGTVATVYGAERDADLVRTVAVGDHVARHAHVHPGTVREVDSAGVAARTQVLPVTTFPLTVTRDGERVRVEDRGEPLLDLTPVRAFWDGWFGMGRWPVEDLYYGLMERFVRRVVTPEPEALAAYRGRSVVYLANHQVGVESLLFSILAGGLQRCPTVTLAKAEHRATWLGRLIAHNFAYPGVRDPKVITFFDRDDKASLPDIIGRLAADLASGERSVMVHVEGTRNLDCRTPVQKMSGAFVDMAIAVGVPIVPVRFVGGLPPDPLPARLEFPVGMGRQDVWIGAPLPPQALAAVPYKERKDRVIAAINGLGPANAEERPLPGDPLLEQRVAERTQRTGAELPHAAILEVLAACADRHPVIDRIVAGDRAGELETGDGPLEGWVAALAERLYGPGGARVRSRR